MADDDDPEAKPTGDTPFLSRWAHRKQAGKQTDKQRAAAPAPTRPAPPREPAFDPATLPAIDDLTVTSDIRDFLRKEVPDALRKLALRKIWSLDPQIRDFREIAENQYDWNAIDGVPGFGPLPEGTDIGALLAQATGQIPAAEAEVVALAAADGDIVVVVDAGAAPPSLDRAASLPEPSTEAAPAHPAQDAPAAVAASSAGNDAEPRALTVGRRHGGALPMMSVS